MIRSKSFSEEWINELKTKRKKIDPTLCEKMIRALCLSEQLVINDLDFIFKGGTSLILLIEKPQRFSIDIDINTEESKENLVSILNDIDSTDLFKHYKEKVRKDKGIPKAHFYFYYDSVINHKENYIMLDVLFDKHLYPTIIETPIQSFWIDTEGEVIKVNTPSLDSILGDKLTVFAPNTTGIKYGIGKSMEIIKQLFDIGRLFDHIEEIKSVATSFHSVASKELAYRSLSKTPKDVLNDIIDTSLIVSQFPGGGKTNSPVLKELLDGLKRFKSFPIDIKYRTDDAIVSAAKAACLAAKLKNKDFSKIERFSDKIKFEDPDFPEKYQHFRRFKRRLPDAYYYWCKTIELIES